jgi:NRPS condensation-like uncharacterized protein
MSKNVKVLTIRLPEAEMLRLEAYCENSGRTKTDVIREQIRKISRFTKIDRLSRPIPDEYSVVL